MGAVTNGGPQARGGPAARAEARAAEARCERDFTDPREHRPSVTNDPVTNAEWRARALATAREGLANALAGEVGPDTEVDLTLGTEAEWRQRTLAKAREDSVRLASVELDAAVRTADQRAAEDYAKTWGAPLYAAEARREIEAAKGRQLSTSGELLDALRARLGHQSAEDDRPLSIQQFSAINAQRCERWHPGFRDHTQGAWSGADWANALAGEVGEACNVVKKLRRIATGAKVGANDPCGEELRAMLADEIGDVFAYLDLLAQHYGLDLAECAADKFNKVSVREGFPERVHP